MALSASKSASLLAGGVILFAALAAYHNSFSGPFVLDDSASIAGNPTIRHLWPLSIPLSPPQGGGQTVEGRPVLNLSLALNYALSGTAVWSYHGLNLAIHILAGLALFGIARRSLLRRESRVAAGAAAESMPSETRTKEGAGVSANHAVLLALAIALLWTLHPLQTESVTYLIQRAESLMGLFYLLTLYCFIRGADVDGGGGAFALRASAGERAARRGSLFWFGLSWLACLFGMATKEVMVSAPLIVLLYDRTFIAGSFRDAWRRRRGFYLGLGATWLPLAWLVFRSGSRGGTSGAGSGVEAWSYWLTQFPAVIRYLRLALWPHPLVFDYGAEGVRSLLTVWPSALAVVLLLAGTAWAGCRRLPGARALSFLAVWFFAVLAPTSLVPGNRQTMAEHRMYLALIPVMVLGVMGLDALIRHCRPSPRPGTRSLLPAESSVKAEGAPSATLALAIIVSALAVGLGLLTANRNRDYRSLLALYADTVAKQAGNAFAQSNLGVGLFSLGRVPEAIGHYEEAIRLRPDYATAHDNLGSALLRVGRLSEAVGQFEEALRLKPDLEEAHHNLGTAYVSLGRLPEAVGQFEAALRLDPESAETRNNFGNVLLRLGRTSEAIAQYREALRLAPDYAEAENDLGNALAAEGKATEAVACFEAALRLNPGYPEAHYDFGNALLGMSRLADAVAQFRAAIQLQPDYASAHDNLGNALLRLDRASEAAVEYEMTIRLQPNYAVAHYNLANALLRLGQSAEAAAQLREALHLQPDFPQARQLLGRLSPAP